MEVLLQMSRVDLKEKLYVKKKPASGFDFDKLAGPLVNQIFSPNDLSRLYNIATSIKYSANIEKKYKEIDSIMKLRGFYKAHCGTNRAVYNNYEDKSFVAKVAVDKVALKDSPAEYLNQWLIKPFCCKIFDVDPTGVLATIERVNPITSLDEFYSLSPDIFNMMLHVLGRCVVDDLGADKYMNYGLRQSTNGFTFGPVILDFPYVYELDGSKLICQKPINTPMEPMPCMGEIDYDESLSHLRCTKCGRKYTAMDLRNDNKNVLIMYGDDIKGESIMRTRIINRKTGKVILDTGLKSRTTITKEEFDSIPVIANNNDSVRIVAKSRFNRYPPMKKVREEHYSKLQMDYHNKMQDEKMSEELKADRKIAINANKQSTSTVTKNAVITNTSSSVDDATVERHLVINTLVKNPIEEPVKKTPVEDTIEDSVAPVDEVTIESEVEETETESNVEDTTESEEETSSEETTTEEVEEEPTEDNSAEESIRIIREADYVTNIEEVEHTTDKEVDEPTEESVDKEIEVTAEQSATEEETADNSITDGSVINEQTDLWQGYNYNEYMQSSGKSQRANRRKQNQNKKFNKHGNNKKGKGYNKFDDEDINNY